MRIKGLLTPFIIILMSLLVASCNVAKQEPVARENVDDSTVVDPPLSLVYNQNFSFGSSQANFAESNASKSLLIKRTGTNFPASQDVIIEITGSAELDDITNISVNGNPVSYFDTNKFIVNFPENVDSQVISIQVFDDNVYEEDETLIIRIISNNNDYSFSGNVQYALTLTDNDSYPVVNFSTTTLSSPEDSMTSLDINITVSNLSEKDIIVPVSFDSIASTSTLNTDIVFTNQLIIFDLASGLTTKSITVILNDDSFNELDETAIFNLGNPIRATVGTISTHTLTITDVSTAASYSLDANTHSLTEGGAELEIDVILTGDIENELRVPLTLAPVTLTPLKGVDYNLNINEVIFPAGSPDGTIAKIKIQAIDDTLYEGVEEFSLTLGSTSTASIGVNGATTITITDNETVPEISIAGSSYQTIEGSTFQLPVLLTSRSAFPIVVNYNLTGSSATAEADYSLPSNTSGSFSIPAGASFYDVPIYISADSTFDQGEIINIELVMAAPNASINAASDSAAITINENANFPSVSFTSETISVDEATNVELTFSLSQASENSQVFTLLMNPLTAISGTDFSATPTANGSPTPTECGVTGLEITFAPNQTTCTISISFVDDPIQEPSEHFEVKILQPINLTLGSISKTIVEIIDNDAASEVSISLDDGAATTMPAITEGSPSNTIYFNLDKISAYDITVNLSLNQSSTATDTVDFSIPSYSVTIPKGQLKAEFEFTSIADNLYETSSETVIFDISSGPFHTLSAQDSVTLTLNESTTAPVLSIVGVPAAVPPLTKGVILQSENNMMNIVFELNRPTTEDITFNYAPLDRFAECDSVAPFIGIEAFKCADIEDDSPELQALISSGATLTIPAGSTRVSLDFRLLADSIFELERPEAFELSIGLVVAGAATVDPLNNLVIIAIQDSNSPSVARFEGDKFLSINEATNDLIKTQLTLSSPSAADSTFKVEIVQTTNSEANIIDENDFQLTNLLLGESAFPGVAVTAGAASSALSYSGSSDVIFAVEITIPAGQTSYDIDLELEHNDLIYEGIEQFMVRITEDDTPPAYYPYTVSSLDNEFTVTVLEGSSLPTVSLTATPLASIAEDQGSPNTYNTITSASYPGTPPATTNLVYTFTASALHQHDDISFDIVSSGTATFKEEMQNFSDYMRHDYSLTLPAASGTTDSSLTLQTFSYTLPPAGTGDPNNFTDSFIINVNRDLRYELDETIIVDIVNVVNINTSGVSSHEVTITNDDIAPSLVTKMNNDDTNSISVNEYEKEHSINYSILGVGSFTGLDATEIPIELTQTINNNLRQSATTESLTSTTIILNEANGFNITSDIDPSRTGDFRRYRSLMMTTTPISGSSTVSAFNNTINFLVPRMQIFTSKGGAYTGTSNNFKGHTCTLFRGRVMCFGSNEYGQLGRENTVDFGGGDNDDLSDSIHRINLGDDPYGHPLYAIDLALGESHTCALLSNKNVKCWGRNDKGQLGQGNSSDRGDTVGSMSVNIPYVNLGSNIEVDSIVAMKSTTCALINAGAMVKCWGDNSLGQTGTEVFTGGTTPSATDNLIGNLSSEMGDSLEAVSLTGSINMLAAGGNHACVALMNNNLLCWGSNNKRQIGIDSADTFVNKDTAGYPSYSNVQNGFSITDLSLGNEHTCLSYSHTSMDIHDTFNTRCFGSNTHGELGIGRIHAAGHSIDGNPAYSQTSLTTVPYTNYMDYLGYSADIFTRSMDLATGGGDSDTNGGSAYLGSVPFSSNIDYGVYVRDDFIRNQYVQIREPATSIAAGGTYTCATYDNYFDASGSTANNKNIRCWGSNKTISYGGTSKETGVLNNIGSNDNFDGLYYGVNLIPYTTQVVGANFITDTNYIGDGSYLIRGTQTPADSHLHLHFGGVNTDTTSTLGDHRYGWVADFFDTDLGDEALNFEMNYLYSNSRETKNIIDRGTDEIYLSAGENHACAVLEENSGNEFELLNDKYSFICWGANASGQAGHNSSDCNTLGGESTCTAPNTITYKKLDYNYN